MSFENVLSRFSLISGLSDEECMRWLPILKDARRYVNSLVTASSLSEKDEERLDNATAAYAYYKYLCYNISSESSFSAGEVSVTFNKDKLQAAEQMWKLEREGISNLISGSDFVFERVPS